MSSTMHLTRNSDCTTYCSERPLAQSQSHTKNIFLTWNPTTEF